MTVKSESTNPLRALVSTVRVSSLVIPTIRLDAKYYQEAFTLAKARVAGCGIPTTPVEEIADAFVPGRMALVVSPDKNSGAPYLRAHDAFDTLPEIRRYLVAERTHNYDSYLLKQGMILTPSSGRNLGPLAYVVFVAEGTFCDFAKFRRLAFYGPTEFIASRWARHAV